MTSSIRHVVADSIAALIGEAIPELLATSKGMQDDEEEIMVWPSLRVIPRSLDLTVFQEDEIETDDELEPDFADTVLARVGEIEGAVEIRIYSKKKLERDRLEDEVMALFLENEDAPGTLRCETPPVTLKGRASAYRLGIGCTLDSTEWDEERVFDMKTFSFISTTVNASVLIARSGVRMTDIRIALAQDLEATTPEEVVRVNEDGSLSPSS